MSDTIYRDAAIDELREEFKKIPTTAIRAMYVIRNLPSAEQWIPVPGKPPEVDEDGCSDYILLSFANYTIPAIGQYREDKEGGAFFDGDMDEPLITYGLIVNAWAPLPKPYRGE